MKIHWEGLLPQHSSAVLLSPCGAFPFTPPLLHPDCHSQTPNHGNTTHLLFRLPQYQDACSPQVHCQTASSTTLQTGFLFSAFPRTSQKIKITLKSHQIKQVTFKSFLICTCMPAVSLTKGEKWGCAIYKY